MGALKQTVCTRRGCEALATKCITATRQEHHGRAALQLDEMPCTNKRIGRITQATLSNSFCDCFSVVYDLSMLVFSRQAGCVL